MALKKDSHEERAELSRLLADIALYSGTYSQQNVLLLEHDLFLKGAKDAVWDENSIHAFLITKYQTYSRNSKTKL